MLPSHLRFDLLRERVSALTLLAHFGLLEHFRLQAGKLRGPCPLHNGDRSDSFVLDPQRGLWFCFSACQRGGDLISLAMGLSGLSYREVAHFLASLADAPTTAKASLSVHPQASNERNFRPFTRTLHLYPQAPFLRAKGISSDIAARFEVGAFHGNGFLKDCIGIRLHDPDGHPLGYMGRRLLEENIARWGKYKLPQGFPKADVLYGWHRCTHRGAQPLIVTECVWAVLRLAALGLPAVALLGCHASTKQLARLRTFPRITLLLDGDPAGREGASRLAELLRSTCRVEILQLPDGYDPDELDDAGLRALLSRP